MKLSISSLTLYPVKSCAGLPVPRIRCGQAGPEWDREWMVVSQEGKFVTQRELPRLALVKPLLDLKANTLQLSFAGAFAGERGGVEISLSAPSAKINAEIWGDLLPALDEGAEAADWLTQALGRPLRLARITPAWRRRGGEDPRTIRFVDSYPIHLTSLASLDDLNRRMAAPVEMNRFRPNVVVEGGVPWQEDHWETVQMGGASYRVGKPCERCVITTTHQDSAVRGPEPLKTLAGFRRNAKNKIEFGQYLHTAVGAELTVGMDVEGV